MSEVSIRPAREDDYEAFVGLIPELGVDDPVPTREKFALEVARSCFVAEAGGAVVGYTFYQVMSGAAYVRHLVVAPSARQSGVGRALMRAVAERARAAGVATWMLNVKPGNVPAIALYESLGMRPEYESQALKIAWERVPAKRAGGETEVFALPPGDDADAERTLRLATGQLAHARTLPERVVLAARVHVHGAGRLAGVAVFNPNFPGASPFRAQTPEVAFALLNALRAHSRPDDQLINLVVEDQRAVADAIVAAGGVVRLEIVHMSGPVPPA